MFFLGFNAPRNFTNQKLLLNASAVINNDCQKRLNDYYNYHYQYNPRIVLNNDRLKNFYISNRNAPVIKMKIYRVASITTSDGVGRAAWRSLSDVASGLNKIYRRSSLGSIYIGSEITQYKFVPQVPALDVSFIIKISRHDVDIIELITILRHYVQQRSFDGNSLDLKSISMEKLSSI
ncbi:unnamed protein product [Dracunculus medinensis]|uniref:SEA domain-containing protein n=1 Tax=Dracunculus medinensis TaxID=318479 RepID=A0A158Q3J0_DRAME|nr:unnamed protein product [Dracunculus medinensis]